jgi:hypothetical protein
LVAADYTTSVVLFCTAMPMTTPIASPILVFTTPTSTMEVSRQITAVVLNCGGGQFTGFHRHAVRAAEEQSAAAPRGR